MQNPQDVQLAAKALLEQLPQNFSRDAGITLGLVLGTGLGDVAAMLEDSENYCRVPYASLPKYPTSGVPTHEGAFIYGELEGMPVLAQQGRCHLYEGRNPAEVCMGIRVMGEVGIGALCITNAAGALNPLFEPGTLMCMADIINHTGVSPLTGKNNEKWGEMFPDMSQPFDASFLEVAQSCALEAGIVLERGVYIGVHGPEMETPAETRMYRAWGADAIGMSTVLEVIAARHMGMRVLGISSLTNRNLPDCMQKASLLDVIAMAQKSGKKLYSLLRLICKKLGESWKITV